MAKFPGFTDSDPSTPIPAAFFRHLLTEIDDLEELKVTLFALWQIGNMEGRVHYMREADFVACLPHPQAALEKALHRGSLLQAIPPASNRKGRNPAPPLYFLNSARGRAAALAYTQGGWQPEPGAPALPSPDRPNIFKQYEENIGPLTPIIADALKDAEQTFQPEWVAEALEIAVKNNKRNWKYVEAILRRWKEEGHAKKQDRRNAQEDGRRYSEGEFAEYLKHDESNPG
jgi:DNA replication protein